MPNSGILAVIDDLNFLQGFPKLSVLLLNDAEIKDEDALLSDHPGITELNLLLANPPMHPNSPPNLKRLFWHKPIRRVQSTIL